MKQQFTTNDLLRYLYDEVSYLERIAIDKALKSDAALAESLAALEEGQDTLNEVELEPSEFSIQAILNYSGSSHFETEPM
jgi:anti-sigma factor RsiW